MIGFDYTERIAPAALKAANCSVVIRYTTWSGWAKSLTPGEADELHAAGIPIAANFESTGDRMKGGAAAGRADAMEARGHLSDDHLPPDLKVWFSADWDVQPSEVPLVLTYLGAAADVLGGVLKVGCYGGLRAVSAAADAGFGIWQTVAWSDGEWDSRAVARQTGVQQTTGGVVVDVNEIINLAALGAWGGPTTGDIVTPEDIAASAKAVNEYSEDTVMVDGKPFKASLFQLAHGAHVSVNDPNGPVLSAINAIRAQVNDLHVRPAPVPVDVATLAAAITAAVVKAVEPAIMQAIPPVQADVENAIAQAVVAHLGLEVVAK